MYTQFYNDVVVHLLDESGEMLLGNFETSSGTELAHVRLTLFKKGTMGGSERARLYLRDTDNSYLVARSEWADISQIDSEGQHWLGWARFDFNREDMPEGTYSLSIEVENYIANDPTYYLAAVLDLAPTIYESEGSPPADASFWGYNV